MLKRYFRLEENNTDVRTEMTAGVATFLTMAYIIVVQPLILSGTFPGLEPTGMDPGAVMTATCIAAAIATAWMGLFARLPIAQAPGMGTNFVFVVSLIPAAQIMINQAVASGELTEGETTAWQVALGVVLISGIAFLLGSLLGVRRLLLKGLSPSMWNAIPIGIGLFIAMIGLKGASLIVADPGTMVSMNPNIAGPDIGLFFFGLFATSALFCRKVKGSIIWGMLLTTAVAFGLRELIPLLPEIIANSETVKNSMLMTQFAPADGVVSLAPSIRPTFFQFDLARAVWPAMIPFILIFLYLDIFDTMGTLAGVLKAADLVEDGEIPNGNRAFLSDAVGTVAGAALGTSTVTSYIESAAGVEQGGRTGLTSLTTAGLFLIAPFFAPLVVMIGSYPVITAPALVIVGALMMQNVRDIDWKNSAEALPAFITFVTIPLTYSIANGMALGFISYPVIKTLAGQHRDVRWLNWLLAAILVVYLVTLY